MSTASPTRTATRSSVATGGWRTAGSGTSITVITPVASATPLLTRYATSTGPSSGRVRLIRTSRCPTTSARTPTASPGETASVITSTPPAGSKSVWSTSTSTSWACRARTNTVCGTVTGRPSDAGAPRTSTRTTPVAAVRPSVTVYSTRCVPAWPPSSRKVLASRSGVICSPARAGTAASRIAPLPPRACVSGSTVISRPSDACTTNPSATSGTSPARRTVTTSSPEPSSRPSDTCSATVRVSPPAPASV
nr:hypothetical protein [Clavibacter michiganensis]